MSPEDTAQINSLMSEKCLDEVAEALDTIELKVTLIIPQHHKYN